MSDGPTEPTLNRLNIKPHLSTSRVPMLTHKSFTIRAVEKHATINTKVNAHKKDTIVPSPLPLFPLNGRSERQVRHIQCKSEKKWHVS